MPPNCRTWPRTAVPESDWPRTPVPLVRFWPNTPRALELYATPYVPAFSPPGKPPGTLKVEDPNNTCRRSSGSSNETSGLNGSAALERTGVHFENRRAGEIEAGDQLRSQTRVIGRVIDVVRTQNEVAVRAGTASSLHRLGGLAQHDSRDHRPCRREHAAPLELVVARGAPPNESVRSGSSSLLASPFVVSR